MAKGNGGNQPETRAKLMEWQEWAENHTVDLQNLVSSGALDTLPELDETTDLRASRFSDAFFHLRQRIELVEHLAQRKADIRRVDQSFRSGRAKARPNKAT